jgi:Flp pilus assembly pilin Flp
MQSGISRVYFRLKSLLELEEGQDLVEYGLIVCLVSVAAIAALRSLAVPINSLLTTVSTTLNGA